MIQIPAIMRDGGQLADGTRRIIFYTQEVAPEQLFELIKLSGKMGYVFFAEEAIRQIDKTKLPEIVVDETERKTPSQRLRDRMFVFFSQVLKKDSKEFEVWYRKELERIGEKYLEKVQ